jgi:dTMP kinase
MPETAGCDLNQKGFFICIEGLDKSGKTSQSILLVEALCKKGFDAIYTTEPSNGEIGTFIRKYLLNRKQRLSAVVEALLFAADRADHTNNQIKPLLREGKVVVSDRYLYSSLAYQGAAGLGLEWIKSINKDALKPDLAIYLDVPISVVTKRYRSNKSVMEWPKIQRKVQEIYLRFVHEGEMISINGNRPIEEASNNIKKIVLEKLNS